MLGAKFSCSIGGKEDSASQEHVHHTSEISTLTQGKNANQTKFSAGVNALKAVHAR